MLVSCIVLARWQCGIFFPMNASLLTDKCFLRFINIYNILNYDIYIYGHSCEVTLIDDWCHGSSCLWISCLCLASFSPLPGKASRPTFGVWAVPSTARAAHFPLLFWFLSLDFAVDFSCLSLLHIGSSSHLHILPLLLLLLLGLLRPPLLLLD